MPLRNLTARLTTLLVAVAVIAVPASSRDRATAAAAVETRNCATSGAGFHCMARTLTFGSLHSHAITPAAVNAYGPADLKAAYALPDTTTTATVAIVDAYGDSTLEADLATYRAQYGLPACTVANGCLTIVNEHGQTAPLPATDSGWAGETSLDVDMVSATCPTCHLLVVQALNADEDGLPHLEDSINTAVSLGAAYVSMSWGGGEGSGDLDRSAYALNHPGVVLVAASGDNGYGSNWPASDPKVVAVGGTSLVRDTSTARGFSETEWSGGYSGATASGCSMIQPRPAWQHLAPITSLCDYRANNDVSVVADPRTGVAVVQNGSWLVMGGTSAGAPIVAAMYAMAGSASAIPASAYPYVHRGSFNDVTSGSSNCGGYTDAMCISTAGWDGPTGVGTPNGLAGFSVPSLASVTVHNPSTVVTWAGSPVRVDAHALNSQGYPMWFTTSGQPSGTGLSASGIFTGTPKRAGTTRVTVRATDLLGTSAATSFYWTVRNHTIVDMTTPYISGAVRAGNAITAMFGAFRRDSRSGPLITTTWNVRWYVDGRATTYTGRFIKVPATWRGHRVTFVVTASKIYFTTYRHTAGSVVAS